MLARLINYHLRNLTDAVRRCRGWWTTRQWLNWAVSEARPYGLEREVSDWFWSDLRSGKHPSIAAQNALYEWDL